MIVKYVFKWIQACLYWLTVEFAYNMVLKPLALWTIENPREVGKLSAIFLTAMLIVRTIQWLAYQRSLPPGPIGIPIYGILKRVRRDLHVEFGEMAKRYGPVFSAKLGQNLVVVISDHKLIKKAFNREEFTARPETEFNNILGGYGIVNSQGQLWKDERRFLHDKFRFFGMRIHGKSEMAACIDTELSLFMSRIDSFNGGKMNLSAPLGMAITNIICQVTMGVRFNIDDKRFLRFTELTNEGFRLFGSLASTNYIPLMRYLPGMNDIYKKLDGNRKEMAAFFQETIEDHRKTYEENKVRHLVDAYIEKIDEARIKGEEDKLFQGKDQDRHLQQILGDLFSAGMETVKTTLEWAVILMLHNPEHAKAVQEELDQVVGRSRNPTLADLPFLPRCEATIMEIMRITSIVPLGTTHSTSRDVLLSGHLIPKGTQVIPLLHAIHMDEELWDEPQKFNPSRFLTTDNKVHKPEFFIPFGAGRRMCLGEVLARMELFLFFSTLLHTYDLTVPEGHELPSLKGNTGITVTPNAFEVCLIKRTPAIQLRNVGSK
ncbi:hypothetical protein TKK_0006772 [Trichogramma kaykai]|uniref:Cytochrome P450 n=1 Tax=Trichogramma kaykai TaxID=54128 RepID=A0ABD2XEK5_9HYME